MGSDRELLELAARAAEENVEWHPIGSYFYRKSCNWPAENGFFNPLHNDGEALRLAVRLRLLINVSEFMVYATDGEAMEEEISEDQDIYEATRRAIVRVAAEIGSKL